MAFTETQCSRNQLQLSIYCAHQDIIIPYNKEFIESITPSSLNVEISFFASE